LSRQALRVLHERGIFAQSSVGLHYQQLAKRHVVRGIESGGAAGDVGHYVSIAEEDGQPVECLHPVELMGVNGPHSVVVAPVLIRLDMLRKGSTYELLITQHQPRSAGNGTRPQLESRILFRGVHGRLELSHRGKDMGRVGTVLPSFYSCSGEGIGIPKRFRAAVRTLTAAVNCQGCEHCHYTTVHQNDVISSVNLPNKKDKHDTDAVTGKISNDLPARPQEPPVVRNELDRPLPGRKREMLMEVFPEYAAVRLLGTRTRYEVGWRAIFDLAAEIRAQRERQRKLVGQNSRARIWKASQPMASAESVREFSMTSLNGNAEFGLHVFKRRTPGKQEDRYNRCVHRRCPTRYPSRCMFGLSLAALRREMERDHSDLVVLSLNTRETSRD